MTAVADDSRPLPASSLSWPIKSKIVWVECNSREYLGRQSTASQGQVDVCKRVVHLLLTPSATSLVSIAIITPYTRQREALTSPIPYVEVATSDGFQGSEADQIIPVRMRCNVSCDVGFLADLRRLNVVMTRANCGVMLVGHKATLKGGVGIYGEITRVRRFGRELSRGVKLLMSNRKYLGALSFDTLLMLEAFDTRPVRM